MVQKQKYYDSALLFLAICVFAYCFFLLYVKPQTYFLSDPSLQVATLEKPTRVVKFKNRDQFSWRDGHVGQPLEAGDRIYTHELSEARINFITGPKLILEPNTLLEISDNLSLDIKSGNILALLESKSDHITILLGKRKFRLSGVDARIRIKKGGNQAQIKVLNGEVSVKAEDSIGAAIDIGPGQFNLSENTELQNTKPTRGLSLLVPDPFNEKPYLPNEKILFKFVGLSDAKLDELIEKVVFAKDPNFKEIIFESPIKTDGSVLLTAITEGMHYIKTIPRISNSATKTQEFSLSIERLQPPIIQGKFGEKFYQGHLEKNPLILQSDAYQIEHFIYNEKNPSLSKRLNTETDTKTNKEDSTEVTLPKNLKAGVYFINSKVFLKKEEARKQYKEQYKEAYLKKIKILKAPNLVAPLINFPTNGYTLYSYGKTEELSMQWSVAGHSTGHSLSLQGAIEEKIETDKSDVTLNLIEEGEYLWRVRNNVDYLFSPWSKERSFILKKLSTLEKFPETGTVIELDKPNQLVTFEWNDEKINKSESYLLEISERNDFTELIKKVETQSSQEKVFFKNTGSYFWRTRIIDREGKVRLGTPKRIIVRPAPPPPPIKLKNKVEKSIEYKSSHSRPILKKNILNTLLNLFISNAYAEEAFTTLSWPREELAKAYILKIYGDAKKEKLILETRVDRAEYVFRNPTEGQYFWEVAIIDYWNRTGEFSNLSLLILKEKALEILLTNPKHKSQLKELETKFSFKTNRPISNFTLLLSKRLDFTKPFYTKDFQSDSNSKTQHSVSIELNKLEGLPKSFYWRIAIKEQGRTVLSLRRKIRLNSSKNIDKRDPLIKTSHDLAIKTKPISNFNLFQEYGLSSFDQSAPAFNVKTSGIFVTSIGFDIKPKSILSEKALIQAKMGRGKTFSDLAYYQGSLSLSYLVTNIWNFDLYFGPRALFQTSFLEQNSNSLTSKNNFLPQLEVLLRKSFFFFSESDYFQLRIGGGKGLSYDLYFKSPIYHLSNKRTLFLGPYYQGISFDEGTREISRNSFGLNLTLSL